VHVSAATGAAVGWTLPVMTEIFLLSSDFGFFLVSTSLLFQFDFLSLALGNISFDVIAIHFEFSEFPLSFLFMSKFLIVFPIFY
jgi:hypothetical protein